jgi:acetolactate synthase small subunit
MSSHLSLVAAPRPLPAPSAASDATPRYPYSFSIEAEAEVSVLPRVLELFAKRGLMPSRLSSRVDEGLGRLAVDLRVESLEEAVAEHVARCLGQLVTVSGVLMFRDDPALRRRA